MYQFKVILKDVAKVYQRSNGALTAITNLNLEVIENEIICIVGPSGCGKTTLIDLIAGVYFPTHGKVLIDGKYVKGQNGTFGVVFQKDSVFPWNTVEKNVEYGLRIKGIEKNARKNIVNNFLRLVGLTEFGNVWPRELSVGMRKRVDLARAFAFNPEVLLLDEPFGSLDVLTKEEMQTLLFRIWQKKKKTILLVTHDPEEAVFLGHKVAIMTQRPGTIKHILNVPFDIPREPSIKLTPEFLKLRKEVVEILEITRDNNK